MRGGAKLKRHNNILDVKGYALKADIKKYFDNVNQEILLNIIKRKVKDERVNSLVKKILDNFESKSHGIGMPLGNLTSQFFANVYLNELDQYVKHDLKAGYYLRYVDDFVILHRDKTLLDYYKNEINSFLMKNLKLELHPEKSKILRIYGGIPLLGFRVFYHHRILRRKATRRIRARIKEWGELYNIGIIERDQTLDRLLGWMAYAVNGDTYHLRKKLMSMFSKYLPAEEKKKSRISKYVEILEKRFIVKNNIIKIKLDIEKLDDYSIKALFSYLDNKRIKLLDSKSSEIIKEFTRLLKDVKISDFLVYFAIMIESTQLEIKFLIVYDNKEYYDVNQLIINIKKHIISEFNVLVNISLITLKEFVKEKENKENELLQQAINYGHILFGNYLFYELIL